MAIQMIMRICPFPFVADRMKKAAPPRTGRIVVHSAMRPKSSANRMNRSAQTTGSAICVARANISPQSCIVPSSLTAMESARRIIAACTKKLPFST